MINPAAVAKVTSHIGDALSHGGRILASGGGLEHGKFRRAVLIGEANPDMLLTREETFGPVAPLFRFGSENEALELANDTPFGLASYFYTRDLSRACRVAERLEAGMVALNAGSVAMEMAPFGGVKQSGLGREGGHAGIEEYLETKACHIGGLDL
ncbi:MAG: aldehyde dehydrogenase family protein [Novosphingobium sp.]